MIKKVNTKFKFYSKLFNPSGSYTGNYIIGNIYEAPEQDVDDL